jgi:hypothetical protein
MAHSMNMFFKKFYLISNIFSTNLLPQLLPLPSKASWGEIKTSFQDPHGSIMIFQLNGNSTW